MVFDDTRGHSCSYSTRQEAPPEMIGAVSGVVQVNFCVAGGELEGPKVRGCARPVVGEANLETFEVRYDVYTVR